MRTKKLNKTEQLNLMTTLLNDTIMSNTELFKKDKAAEMIKSLTNVFNGAFAPKSGGGTSTKIDEAGNVYCNYFGDYFPSNEFATKLSKPNKTTGERTEGYKANSKAAELIIRKVKQLKTNCTNQVVNAFSTKTITADEMQDHLEAIDSACDTKYNDINDVPKSMDVLGLTKAMS